MYQRENFVWIITWENQNQAFMCKGDSEHLAASTLAIVLVGAKIFKNWLEGNEELAFGSNQYLVRRAGKYHLQFKADLQLPANSTSISHYKMKTAPENIGVHQFLEDNFYQQCIMELERKKEIEMQEPGARSLDLIPSSQQE